MEQDSIETNDQKGEAKKTSLSKRMLDRLKDFAGALERKEDLASRFTCRRVASNISITTKDQDGVRKTRQLLGLSQARFAQFFGVSAKTVRAWEHGVNTPSDLACRFMDEIRRNPKYWIRRLSEAAVRK